MGRLRAFLQPSLLTRVIGALVVVGLFPIALLTYRLVGIHRTAMETQVELSQIRVAQTVASRLDAELATLLSLANGLAGNSALSNPLSVAAQDLLRSSLGGWGRLGVLGVAVVNPDGELVILAQSPDEESKRRVRESLGIPFEDLVEISVRPPPGKENGEEVDSEELVIDLRVAQPLPEDRGYVCLIADGSVIRDAVLDPEQLGLDAALVLAHRSGYSILGSLEEFPVDTLEGAFSARLKGNKATFRTEDGNQLGAYAPVDNAPWAVLARQRLVSAQRVARRMEQESWLALSMVALAVVAFTGVAYRTTVKPIRELAAAQRRLVGGRIGSEGSEIQQLRASFDALEERLADRSALDEVFLGRYQVRDVIGSGAMGTVFRGYDPRLQRPVALKTIRLDQKLPAERRTELLARLLHEAVTTARFNHPNIVAVYDVEDQGGAAFMAMEYIDGGSLEVLVSDHGSLEQGAVAILGRDVAKALGAAHANRLVHRDIKPANILLGTDGAIKVTDFGIAQLVSSMSGREDVVFGTPGFLPPETLQGKGYDASGDLFSLGAVLYFSLTGRRPFEAKTVRDVIRKTLFGSLTPLSQIESDTDPELDSLIMGLLSNDQRRRPQNANTVAERLDLIARRIGGQWRPPGQADSRSGATGDAPEASFVETRKLET
jgi:hypothetical protein